MSSVYCRHGYKDRDHYLDELALEYDLPSEVVRSISDLLGESEDFDGLVNALEDAEGSFP